MVRRHYRIKLFSLLIILSSLGALVTTDSLVYATTASSPSGTQEADWYKDSASISFNWAKTSQPGDNYIGVCTYGVSWDGYSPAGITYNFTRSGQHNYDFLTNTRGDIYVSIDSGSPQPVIAVCQNQTAMYPPDSGSVLWQGNVNLDNSSPTVGINNPANNSNVSSNTVTISGTVSDTDSGVAKVLVNGTQASVSGNTFSATISLNQGLNTISAVAYDQVGHSTSNSVVVLSSATNTTAGTSGTGASSANKTSTAPKSSSGNIASPNATSSSPNRGNSTGVNGKTTSFNLASKSTSSKSSPAGWIVTIILLVIGAGLSVKFSWHKKLISKFIKTKELRE